MERDPEPTVAYQERQITISEACGLMWSSRDECRNRTTICLWRAGWNSPGMENRATPRPHGLCYGPSSDCVATIPPPARSARAKKHSLAASKFLSHWQSCSPYRLFLLSLLKSHRPERTSPLRADCRIPSAHLLGSMNDKPGKQNPCHQENNPPSPRPPPIFPLFGHRLFLEKHSQTKVNSFCRCRLRLPANRLPSDLLLRNIQGRAVTPRLWYADR